MHVVQFNFNSFGYFKGPTKTILAALQIWVLFNHKWRIVLIVLSKHAKCFTKVHKFDFIPFKFALNSQIRN